MFQAIAAVIGAVLGFAGSIDKSATAKYLTYRAEDEASIDYSRQKNLSFYTAYQNQVIAIAAIAFIGFAFVIGIIYFNKKK